MTKKDIKKYSKVTVIKNEDGKIKTFKTTVKERIATEMTVRMPAPYMNLDIYYPTKKNQHGFTIEEEKVVCNLYKGMIKIIFEQ